MTQSNTRVDRIALFKKVLTYGKSTKQYCKDHSLTNYAAISDKIRKAKDELRWSKKQGVIDYLKGFCSDSNDIAFFRNDWLKAIEIYQEQEKNSIEWTNIKNGIPDVSDVLVIGKMEGDTIADMYMAMFYEDELKFVCVGDSSDRQIYSVTHWMPIPKYPCQ
jgi:hypothetical protein